jgi:hypothetical protein
MQRWSCLFRENLWFAEFKARIDLIFLEIRILRDQARFAGGIYQDESSADLSDMDKR